MHLPLLNVIQHYLAKEVRQNAMCALCGCSLEIV